MFTWTYTALFVCWSYAPTITGTFIIRGHKPTSFRKRANKAILKDNSSLHVKTRRTKMNLNKWNKKIRVTPDGRARLDSCTCQTQRFDQFPEFHEWTWETGFIYTSQKHKDLTSFQNSSRKLTSSHEAVHLGRISKCIDRMNCTIGWIWAKPSL